MRRKFLTLTAFLLLSLIWGNFIYGFTAANTLTKGGGYVRTLPVRAANPMDFLPIECQGKVTISMIATTSNPPQPALILGTAGVDNLNGGGGPDCIVGGAGNDTLSGGAGTTVFVGGAGNDTITGGGGTDYLYGGDGNDSLNGGRGNDFLYGENGDDTLNGAQNTDTCDGGPNTPVGDTATQCEITTNVP